MESCDIKVSEFAKMIADQINSGSQFTTNNNYTSGASYQTKNYSTASTCSNTTNQYPQMRKSTNVSSSRQVSIPINIQLANELKNLSNEITYGQNELQEILDSLDTSSLEVTIRRRWWGGTDHESIKEGFENVYSNLGNYIGKCGKALQQTNENLGRTLELIKLLALVEKELYEHIENQTVSNNELKTVIHDWFRKQGIRDEEVQELLETSFKRAYTLRDRLNALRQENEESIARLEERITALEKKQSSNNVKTILSNTGETNNNSLGSAVGWTLIGSAIISGIVSYLITAII
jgi:chemotaxis protein histidine kinase CheA